MTGRYLISLESGFWVLENENPEPVHAEVLLEWGQHQDGLAEAIQSACEQQEVSR